MAIDYDSDVGRVRLLAADTYEPNLLLTDDQIESLLAMESGVKRAAAAALEIIATSEVLISKKITTQDLSTDGPAVAAELRARAKALRDQAKTEEDDIGGYGLDIVDYDPWVAYRCWG